MSTFRLGWATDVHLDHAGPHAAALLGRELLTGAPEAVVLTGDITEAIDIHQSLDAIQAELTPYRVPLYFVLGNHDYYGSTVSSVRSLIRPGKIQGNPIHLQQSDPITLAPGIKLVGVDGWGDYRYGTLTMRGLYNDAFRIGDLREAYLQKKLPAAMRRLGTADAQRLKRLIDAALPGAKLIVVATHVPPFPEACWRGGRWGDPDALPYFACKATGDVLKRAAMDNPHVRFQVLCGHTHGGGTGTIFPNLTSLTGYARVKYPAAQTPLDLKA